MLRTIKPSEVQVIKEYYPRFGVDNDYLELLNEAPWETLPPITVNGDLLLIDGLHRLTKARLENITEIQAEVEDIPKEEILARAIEINAKHGHQLTIEEKKRQIQPLYRNGMRDKEALATLLGVSPRLIQRETSGIDKEEEKVRDDEILRLYLNGYTQEDIGQEVILDQSTVAKALGNMKKRIGAENHSPDKPPIGDVWNYAGCDDNYGMPGFPGRIPGQIVENLLHFYTDVFDLVVDPMAGSGTTKDVANKMYRRCVVSDVNPVKEGITQHDVATGYLPRQKRAALVVLDPPYYKKKAAEYDAAAISSLDRGAYLEFFVKLAQDSYKTLSTGGHLALIMSNYLDEDAPERSIWIWDYVAMFKQAGLVPIKEIHCDLTSQSLHPGHVQQFRSEKRMARLTRSIIVFKKYENRQTPALHSEP